MYELSDFQPGQRVQLHPASDLWMRGARYGTVVRAGRQWVLVNLDMTGLIHAIEPKDIAEIL